VVYRYDDGCIAGTVALYETMMELWFERGWSPFRTRQYHYLCIFLFEKLITLKSVMKSNISVPWLLETTHTGKE
jgi:hypothetical protein